MTFQFCDQRCLSCETDSVSVCAAHLDIRDLKCDQDSIRACGEGIDGAIRTIRTDQHNVLATLPSSSAHSQIGRMFSVTDNNTFEDFLPFHYILFNNPLTSGRIMYLDSIAGGVRNGTLNLDIISNPIFNIIQVEDIFNLNVGSPETSAMMVGNHTERFGGAVIFSMIEIPNSFYLKFAGKIIVPPGHTISIQLSGGFNAFYNITVIWYEPDIPAI